MAVENRRLKILVGGHDQKFWQPIQRRIAESEDYEFREDLWSGHNEHDSEASLAMLNWADVVIAEWALGNAVFYSRNKRPGQRLIVRLHLQERNTRFPAEIDYDQVDAIVFVSNHLREECLRRFPIPQEKAIVIGNAIDVARYRRPKHSGSEYNLGMIGTVPARKRLDRAISVLEELVAVDDRYVLRIKGPSPDSYDWLWSRTAEREYFETLYRHINSGPLRHKVVFDPAGDNVEEWLQQIGFILSPSDFESFHMAVAEGATSGAVPVVWNWEGAETIYPSIPLFLNPGDAAKFIRTCQQSATTPRLLDHIKSRVESTFELSTVATRWTALIGDTRPNGIGATTPRRRESPRDGVLVVWAIDRWSTFHRREMLSALADHLSEVCDVLVIEPGNHYQTLLDRQLASPDELDRLVQLQPVQVGENLFRIRIVNDGLPAGLAPLPRALRNRRYAEAAHSAIAAIFGANRPVVHWLYKPDQLKWLRETDRFIYEVYDDYTLDFATSRTLPAMEEAETRALPSAEHVFFTSPVLAERKSWRARAWTVVGNGVDYPAFEQYRRREPVRRDPLRRPAVGYLGNLSDFFAWETVLEVASSMPDVDFILMGPTETARLADRMATVDALGRLPNVLLTGRMTRQQGAAGIGRCDALIIPFVRNAAMDAVEPLKLWEYLATGLPVVCAPLAAIKVSEPLVRRADTAAAWVNALRASLDEALPHLRSERRALAEAAAWSRRTAMHANVVMDLFQ